MHAAKASSGATAAPTDSALLDRLRASSMLDWKGEQQRVGYANMEGDSDYWPAAFHNDLVSHNDTFVDAVVALAGSSGAR